jgi:hypothetical protein
MMAAMRAEIRRIDLTTEPATVEAWPSLDWLESPSPSTFNVETPENVAPRGRGGLWDAMAQAVQRARQAPLTDGADIDADMVTLAVDAPHLAYLARVAAGAAHADDDASSADVIALDDARSRDLR